MKKHLAYLFAALAVGLLAGLWVGCSAETDFDTAEEGIYSCSADRDCLPGFECACLSGDDCGDHTFCMRPTDLPINHNDGPRPDTCEPEELGEDYPLDPPLDITEVCDGVDNNCDGQVDVMYCERNSDCDNDAKDPNGVDLRRRCNTGTGLCEFFAPDEFACPDPIPCVEGSFQAVPSECLL